MGREDTAKIIAAGAAATAAAVVAYKVVTSRGSSCDSALELSAHLQLVVFPDAANSLALPRGLSLPRGKVLRWPRHGPIADLIAAVSALLGIENVRLFLEATREELLTTPESLAALEAASGAAQSIVLVIATAGGAPLSSAAAGLPPIKPPPYAGRALPMFGHSLYFFRGPYEIPMYNVWHATAGPDNANPYGDTVRLVMPAAMVGAAALGEAEGAAGCDDRSSRAETIFTWDPEVAAELVARQEDFMKMWNRPPEKRLQEFASNGIFTTSTTDPDWASIHGLLPRAFNALKVKGFYPAILDKTRIFMHEWNKRVAGAGAEGVEITHVNDWFACMTADAVVKCALGLDMRNVERKGADQPLHPFIRVFRQGLGAALGRADLKEEMGWSYYCPFVSRKDATDRILRRARAEGEEMVSDMVEKTRRGEIGDSNSVIAAMLNDKSPSTGEYVRLQTMYGHLINLMVAGHETTATTLAWTLYYLSKNPECEAKALAEIREVLGDATEPTADHIPKLHYVEACFREALRLHPAVVAVARDAAADTLLKGKYLVRRGQRITINLVALHRREDQWGGPFGDPNTYNPDRFMPGAYEKAGLPPRHPQAFLPWGFGVRACLGQLFALWEAKCFLAMLLPRFKLRTPVGYVPVASTKEGGATPLPFNLSLIATQRPNAPPVTLPSSTPAPAAAAAAPKAAAGAAAAPAAAAPAGGASHGTPLAVVFGSNSGMCEDLAAQLADKARAAGFAVTLGSLDLAIAGGGLPTSGAVAVVTSTYNGMPPDDAAAFNKWLGGLAPGGAAGARYAVFGVGNSQWAATFQAFPKRVDGLLAKAGAAQLAPLATADVDQGNVADAFDDWGDTLVAAMLTAFQVASPGGASTGGAPAPASEDRNRVQIEALEPGAVSGAHVVVSVDEATADAIRQIEAAVNKSVALPTGTVYAPLEVLPESRQLLPADSARATRHVELALPEGMNYSAGDHLEVLAANCPALVDAALQVLGLSGSERFVWTAGSKESAARGLGAGHKPPARLGDRLPGIRIEASARLLLATLPDLSAVPSRKLVAALAELCPCPPEAAALRSLASEEGYASGVAGVKLTLVELLARFRSVPMTVPALVNALPRLAPRYYSISSSPLRDPRRCSVTVGLIAFTSATGRMHRGASSGNIHSKPVGGHLIGMVRVLQSTFKLPKDPSTPIIMVGPGTGVAPMLGFMQERDALLRSKRALGPALLFFGCRSPSEDYIYRDTLETYAASGVLTGLHVAFSRDGPSKVYVQDLIQQQAAEVWRLLEAGAYVYVCGDARRMAPDVRRAFMAVARGAGGRSEASAQNWMGSLLEAGRYLEDVWAG